MRHSDAAICSASGPGDQLAVVGGGRRRQRGHSMSPFLHPRSSSRNWRGQIDWRPACISADSIGRSSPSSLSTRRGDSWRPSSHALKPVSAGNGMASTSNGLRQVTGRRHSFSSFAYTELAFDVQLDGWLTEAGHVTDCEKATLNNIPRLTTLMRECRSRGNGREQLLRRRNVRRSARSFGSIAGSVGEFR